MGSTPTGASLRTFAGSVLAAWLLIVGGGRAEAQIGDALQPPPVPGAAPPSNYVGEPAYPGTGSMPADGSVRRSTDAEMEAYFDGRVADKTFFSPECSWRDRVCYGYVSVDALYWDRVRSGNGTVAVNDANGSVIFNATSFVWDDWETLPRLTGGFVFNSGYALEASYFYKDDLDTSNGVSNPGNVDMVAFGTPTVAFAPNYLQADTLNASSSLAIQSAETNLMETNGFINLLLGFRWIEMQDRLRVQVNKAGVLSNFDSFTYNTLLGGQVGVRMNQHFGVFGLEGTAKIGMFLNVGNSHITTTNAGAGLANQTRNANGNSEAFMAEGEIMATYNPYIWLRARLGWQVFMIQQTALAIDQIHQNNTTGFTLNERGDLIYHGPFAGVEFRW